MIKVQNLYKSYGKNQVLKGLDLNFNEQGKVIAILGPNGSGKTTLIKCLLGMVLPDQGQLTIFEKAIRNAYAYRSQVNYLPQIARFPENLSVAELIKLIKDIRGTRGQDQELIQRFGLTPFLNKRLVNLSGGTKQKVNLTLAFMYDNPLIILDEPTSGLDPLAMVALRELLQQERDAGKLILVTTHIMSFVEEIADEIVFLLEGKSYFQGSTQDLLDDYQASSVERAIANILTLKQPAISSQPIVNNYTVKTTESITN